MREAPGRNGIPFYPCSLAADMSSGIASKPAFVMGASLDVVAILSNISSNASNTTFLVNTTNSSSFNVTNFTTSKTSSSPLPLSPYVWSAPSLADQSWWKSSWATGKRGAHPLSANDTHRLKAVETYLERGPSVSDAARYQGMTLILIVFSSQVLTRVARISFMDIVRFSLSWTELAAVEITFGMVVVAFLSMIEGIRDAASGLSLVFCSILCFALLRVSANAKTSKEVEEMMENSEKGGEDGGGTFVGADEDKTLKSYHMRPRRASGEFECAGESDEEGGRERGKEEHHSAVVRDRAGTSRNSRKLKVGVSLPAPAGAKYKVKVEKKKDDSGGSGRQRRLQMRVDEAEEKAEMAIERAEKAETELQALREQVEALAAVVGKLKEK